MARNSLNSRRSQIVWPIVVIALAGMVLEVPFAWRALRTKKRSDVWVAAVFGVVQVVVYVAYATDRSPASGGLSNVAGAVVWFCAFTAAVAAAWLYRPLDKAEEMDRAARDQRPGSSYLN